MLNQEPEIPYLRLLNPQLRRENIFLSDPVETLWVFIQLVHKRQKTNQKLLFAQCSMSSMMLKKYSPGTEAMDRVTQRIYETGIFRQEILKKLLRRKKSLFLKISAKSAPRSFLWLRSGSQCWRGLVSPSSRSPRFTPRCCSTSAPCRWHRWPSSLREWPICSRGKPLLWRRPPHEFHTF